MILTVYPLDTGLGEWIRHCKVESDRHLQEIEHLRKRVKELEDKT